MARGKLIVRERRGIDEIAENEFADYAPRNLPVPVENIRNTLPAEQNGLPDYYKSVRENMDACQGFAHKHYQQLDDIVRDINKVQKKIDKKVEEIKGAQEGWAYRAINTAKNTLLGSGPGMKELCQQQEGNIESLILRGCGVVREMERELTKLHSYTFDNIERNREETQRAKEIKELLPKYEREYKACFNELKNMTDENPRYFDLDKKKHKLWFDIKELKNQQDLLASDKQMTKKQRAILVYVTERLDNFCTNTKNILHKGSRANETIATALSAYDGVPEGVRSIRELEIAVGDMARTVEEMDGYMNRSYNEVQLLAEENYPRLGE